MATLASHPTHPTTVKAAAGGSFLLEERTPQEIFTPEDFNDEQRQIAETASNFAQQEILPKLAADPGYLASHHMRFRSNGSIQQEAGPYSALGRLKFEMADRYDVYLHDTPTKSLFQAAARMMSHGCIRVENPRMLAALLLGATPEAIEKGIAAGRTHRQALPAPIPVFVVYQTAYVESDGAIRFAGDPYQRDDEIWQRLTRGQRQPIAQDSSTGQRKG